MISYTLTAATMNYACQILNCLSLWETYIVPHQFVLHKKQANYYKSQLVDAFYVNKIAASVLPLQSRHFFFFCHQVYNTSRVLPFSARSFQAFFPVLHNHHIRNKQCIVLFVRHSSFVIYIKMLQLAQLYIFV